MDYISILGASEGNLKNLSVDIPKYSLTVFTGLSGSGKSTLLVDVLYMECQRQHLEAMSFQGIAKPKVSRIRNATPAIVISQNDSNRNPRSTVGTLTNIYTDLRMIYEKLGVRTCPFCGEVICAADCREETEKIHNDFYVYMYCSACGQRMHKLNRTDFSFNTKEGACPSCEGLGEILDVDRSALVNESLSPEDGAVDFWDGRYKDYETECLYASFQYYGIPVPPNTPVAQFSDLQKAILYDGIESPLIAAAFPELKPPKTVALGRFEGLIPTLKRRLANQNGELKRLQKYFSSVECPDCRGERLGILSRSVTVNGIRLPELTRISLRELNVWLLELEDFLSPVHRESVKDYLLDIGTKLSRFLKVGLGYLSLDRRMITLSGGELQRLRLAAVLDSDLTGLTYILDEPTAGLHPKDTKGLIAILQRLRDLGNTVLVIEHDPDVMQAADHIIDVGPGSGKYGGQIIAEGTLFEIMDNPSSVTGQWLRNHPPHQIPVKSDCRTGDGTVLSIEHASRFNLQDIHVTIPCGCLTTVTGPSGSGKSTLIFEILARGNHFGKENSVRGCEQFDRIIEISQSPINRMKRSNVATYTDVYTEIRKLFAALPDAKERRLTAKHFSFNTPGGRCEHCEGMGTVTNNLLFFADTEVTCPVCRGRRFQDNVLEVTFRGLTITDVLRLSVNEACSLLKDYPKIIRTLTLLCDVGLGYLELGQSLTTLSGGEGQRLKLAKELIGNTSARSLYLMDEPTSGLHPVDIEHFLVLLNRLVDSGSTVIVVEHNQQIIRESDYIIDLGPSGGIEGGRLIFTGTPAGLLSDSQSVTAQFL